MNTGDECDAVSSGGNLLAYGRKLCTSFDVHELGQNISPKRR